MSSNLKYQVDLEGGVAVSVGISVIVSAASVAVAWATSGMVVASGSLPQAERTDTNNLSCYLNNAHDRTECHESGMLRLAGGMLELQVMLLTGILLDLWF